MPFRACQASGRPCSSAWLMPTCPFPRTMNASSGKWPCLRTSATFPRKLPVSPPILTSSAPCAVPPLLRAGLWISFARKSSGEFNTIGSKANDSTLVHLVVAAQDGAGEDQGNRFRTSNDSHETAIGNIAGGIRAFRFREDDAVPPRDGKRSVRVQHFLHDAPAQTRRSQWSRINISLTPAELTPGWSGETFWNMRRCTGNRYGTLKADILTLLEQGKKRGDGY